MKAHNPHPENKKTFFGFFKDDGFIKRKNSGRIDGNNKWDEIRSVWLNAYINSEEIASLSVKKAIKHSDEWCAESYMQTNYNSLTEQDFVKTIRDFVSYKFTAEV